MRSRFHIAAICLFSLLGAPALLAQSPKRERSSRTSRKAETRSTGASTRSTRSTAEAKSGGKTKSGAPQPVKGNTDPAAKRTQTSTAATEAKSRSTGAKSTKDSKSTATSETPKSAVSKSPEGSEKSKIGQVAAKNGAGAKTRAASLAAADQAYFKKDYPGALRQYQAALRQRTVPQERRPLVEYRIARSLGYTEQWDAAIAESLRVAGRYPNTIWDARSKSWLMRLYLKAPHVGWRVGERYFRGAEAPETDVAEQPEQVDLTSEDWRKAILYGEQSKLLYEKLRAETKGSGEETDLTADLARLIAGTQVPNWAEGQRWKPAADDSWKIDPAAAYDPTWAPPKKVLQLYVSAEEQGTRAQKPLVRLAQARWLHDYELLMQRVAGSLPSAGASQPTPYPYQDRSAAEALRALSRDYPDHPVSDQALFTAGVWLANSGRFSEALETYDALTKARPDSKWAQAAKSASTLITRAVLNVESPQPQAPGQKATLEVKARNLASLKFAAYPLKLEDAIKDGRVLTRPRAGISELLARIGKSAGLKKYYQGEPITWEQTLTPKSDYAWVNQRIETPLTKNGAYALEIEGGSVRATAVLLISDLAAIQVVDRSRATAMVVNAATGVPVADAQVLIREVYTDAEKKQAVSAATFTSNAEGLAEKPHSPRGVASDDVLTFAWKGDRYAFTGGASPLRSSELVSATAYLYTDRPVYRPGEAINFRALLATRSGEGRWQPLAGQKATVRLFDAKGAPVETAEVTANEFGTVHGKFSLGSQPPLGHYRIEVRWDDKNQEAGGQSRFRVAEYQKPAFTVSVTPAAKPAHVGEPLQARIAARDYSGAAIANAPIRYRVMRSEWFPASLSQFNASGRPANREPLPEMAPLQGSAVTDANGEAVISIDTQVDDPRIKGRHLVFRIAAEVTDASRRAITGHGIVRVPATEFSASVQATRGFVSAGDPLTVEVRTVDAAGQPVAVRGTGRVVRVVAAGEKPRTEEVFSGQVRTDTSGRGTFSWTRTRPGRYEVRFEASDNREQRVIAGTEAWVAGENAAEGLSASEPLRLIPEVATYPAGGKARLLLVAAQPNTTVLLTLEAGTQLIGQRVVRAEGRSKVLEITLDRVTSPGLILTASGVNNRRFLHTSATLRMPVAEQLLTVEVSPDKSVYKPGEKATLLLRARDANGQPVRTELSAVVFDASLASSAGTTFQSLADTLYSQEFGSSLSSQESFTPAITSLEEDQQPPLKLASVDWTEPEGLGNIEAELLDSLPGNRSWAGEMAPGEAAEAGEAATQPAAPMGEAKRKQPPSSAPTFGGNFVNTVFWTPTVTTDAHGEATVSFTWPNDLARWQVLARGWSPNGLVGEGYAETVTAKDLLVRLEAPRFSAEQAEVVLAAHVHNYTPGSQKVKVSLQLEGPALAVADAAAPGPPAPRSFSVPRADRPGSALKFDEEPAAADPLTQWVEVPAGGAQRVEWRVRVDRSGDAKIRIQAEAPVDTDTEELTFPVQLNGTEKSPTKPVNAPRKGPKTGSRTSR